MPKVSDAYRAAKRDEIVQAAIVAFQRKGFRAASMADIIAASGLSAGAIYGHFASKSEIVIAVASRVVGARIGEVEEFRSMDPLPPPASLVRALMHGMLRDMGSSALLVQLWGEAVTDPAIRELATGVLARLQATYAGYISLWQQREHGLSAEEADAVADGQVALFVGAAQGYILQSALVDDFDGERYLTNIEQNLPR
jgi:AcrR family transcriptional regulator